MIFLDLLYFFMVWALFLYSRLFLSGGFSKIAPFICGLLLAFPVSLLISIDEWHIYFYKKDSFAYVFSVSSFLEVKQRIFWGCLTILPLLWFHALLGKKPSITQIRKGMT